MSSNRRGRKAWASRRELLASRAAVLLAMAYIGVAAASARQAAPAQARAQTPAQTGDPALHRRSAARESAEANPVLATGHTSLPPEAEGEYPFSSAGDQRGGEVVIYFESGKLGGYMTQSMDPNPHAGPVTFEFATTHADGHAVEWTTRVVHGTSYSFAGHLERGVAASTALLGFYLLAGTLTQHGGDADGLRQTVSLKREPGTP